MAARTAHCVQSATILAAVLLLAACAGMDSQLRDTPAHVTQQVSSPAGTPPSTPVSRGQHIASIARNLVGAPYRYGGEDPSQGFDCSGLVYFAHRQVKLSIPRTSVDQYRAARPIQLPQARAGDLVFFTDQSKVSHVGIYLGEQRFVHAPASGRRVSIARLDEPYYREHLVALGRLY